MADSYLDDLTALTAAVDADTLLIQDASAGPTDKKITLAYLAAGMGVPRLYRKAIAYNDANIRTGVTVYTPAVGDWLLDAWFSVTTAWNGTTPMGDLAQFSLLSNGAPGWIATETGDAELMDSGVDQAGAGDQYIWSPFGAAMIQQGNDGTARLSGYFASVDPIQYIVTQDGTKNGAATGASQGAGYVYLLIAKPITL